MATSHPIRFGETETLAETDPSTSHDEAFSLLVYRQHRFVFRVAYALLRSVQDAEDVAQDAFLKLYRNRTWIGMRDERAFLARTTWRLALDLSRARQRSPRLEPSAIDADQTASPTANAEQQIVAAETTATVHRLIDALPEELRQPLVLSSIDELTSREIATVLSLPEGTVRRRLMRARQLLKQKMTNSKEVRHAR